jgi:hypothetical protein
MQLCWELKYKGYDKSINWTFMKWKSQLKGEAKYYKLDLKVEHLEELQLEFWCRIVERWFESVKSI